MKVTRRRFLTITAAATLLSGVRYDEHRWAGHALGAETSLVFRAPKDVAEGTISSVLGLVERFENTFSIYRNASEISTLNQAAYIKPSKLFFELADYVDEIWNVADEKETGDRQKQGDKDILYESALEIIRSEGKASTSFLQRKLQIGYNRAARIIDMMEADGIVSKANHVGKRDVL